MTSQSHTRSPILLDERQLADKLSLSTRLLQKWRQNGEGPKYIKVTNKSVRYRLSDVEDFLALKAKLSMKARGRK